MTRQEQIDLIRPACLEANPTDSTQLDQHSWQGLQTKRKTGRPIRLADVLLAIPTLWVQPKTDVGNGTRFIHSGMANSGISWNLRRDDLAEQSDECVAFLANLLG